MNTEDALRFLTQYIDEIDHLRTLHYSNDEYRLWKNKVYNVLEAAFGKNSSEYGELNCVIPIARRSKTDTQKQEEYINSLIWHELGIKRILLLYKMLGFSSLYEVKNSKSEIDRPKAFIAHGGQSARLIKLCDFLEALGIEPVVAEWSASEGGWTEEHVERRLEDADCYIILAEYGGIIDVKTGAKHPRLNVIDELGRSRQKRPNRTILLLEKGISLGSNTSGIVYEHFTKTNMEKAFIKVARELQAFGIIRTVKPQ